jgi:hypothetical protein
MRIVVCIAATVVVGEVLHGWGDIIAHALFEPPGSSTSLPSHDSPHQPSNVSDCRRGEHASVKAVSPPGCTVGPTSLWVLRRNLASGGGKFSWRG